MKGKLPHESVTNKLTVTIAAATLESKRILGTRLLSVNEPLACENSCFSSLFAAGEFSRGGTSATQ